MPKVSVIVPIYGVEKYIERCARSLFEQTLEDMEFIFVDDCTPDKSISVLNEVIKCYPNRKGQIKILHHEQNRGVSRGRETGIINASGEYIAHCDSDDWSEPEMYETLYNYAINGNYDFVRCSFYVTDGVTKIKKNITCPQEPLTKTSIISELLADKQWNSIWNTLTKRELYEDNILFTDYAMLEDYFLVVQLLTHATKIGVIQNALYNYFQNPNSICQTQQEDSFIRRGKQSFANASWILAFIDHNYGKDKFLEERVILQYIVRRMIIPIMNSTKNYALWDTFFKHVGFKPCFSKHLSLKSRLQYFLVQSRLYPLYSIIFK